MTAKMGRPTDAPKTYNTRIRMSEEDVKKLEYCCNQTDMTKADVLRLGLQEVYDKLKK